VITVLTTTNLPGIERVASGKVRDVYRIDDDLLIVATDRISAFDCILPQGIPGKGRVLTQMSLFWFNLLHGAIPNHLITADVNAYPLPLHAYRDQLEGRSMLVKRCRMEPIECVARGYISGSGWKDYKRTGAICGIPLPPGLLESDRLPAPIFTPATKAESGHDENISFADAESLTGRQTAALLRDVTLRIYDRASAYAEQRGIIIADTKFEFGWHNGALLLADEVLTPDSSRFWPRDEYQPGGPQKSFDTQVVRDYRETLDWN
jgi:phosphoribosylaminoimidazole-succinocarboxamide synthase